MRIWRRIGQIGIGIVLLAILTGLFATPARADNCGSFSDCFNTIATAILVAAAIAAVLVLAAYVLPELLGLEAIADAGLMEAEEAGVSELFGPSLGGEGSSLTEFGQGLINELRQMGVEVVENDPEQWAYLESQDAAAVTRFWGNSAADTQVVLGPNVNDATVYEEYLHVLEGQARGWTGIGAPEAWAEEVQVERQVLSMADQLGMTAAERASLEQTIQSYIDALARFGIHL